ncbi:hypothetical protein EON65_05405 [archaeon]|nr:MAG: hypothetical protein EON65_05405 [archaeon]
MTSLASSSPRVYDCIIVGGGVSGLKTARDLVSKHGASIDRLLILEAQDYVGGRIRQCEDFIPGVKVELGAEILHGQNTELTRFAEEQNEPIEEIYCWVSI